MQLVVDDVDVKAVNRLLRERKERRSAFTTCVCGCGTEIPSKTMRGTPRQFVKGHKQKLLSKNRTEKITLFLSPEEHAWLKAEAARSGVSMMAVLRQGLHERRERNAVSRKEVRD